MIWKVHRLIDDEFLGTVHAPSIGHACVKAAEEFADEGLCRVSPADQLQVVVGEWREGGKVVGNG